MEYLSKIQERFLKEEGIAKTRWKDHRRILGFLHQHESDKQLHQLKSDKMKEIITDVLSTREITTAVNYIDCIEAYFEWVHREIEPIKVDYVKILKEVKSRLEYNLNLLVFGRKEIYELAKEFEDKQQTLLVTLLFEGVRATLKSAEILQLKKSDVNHTTLRLRESNFELPEEMVDIIESGYNQIESGNNCNYLINDYLIHCAKQNDIQNRQSYNYVNSRVTRLRELNLTINSLAYSGVLFYMSLIDQIKMGISDEDICKVLTRYGKEINDKELIKVRRRYEKYKLSGKYEPNIDISKYSKILSNIMAYEYDQTEVFKVNQKLGELGEAYMFKFLKKDKGENNVIDQTKNKVGYDFLVISEKLKCEVKSTSEIRDVFEFYMTMGEIRQAYNAKEKYIIYVLSFIKEKVVAMYEIANPIKSLNLDSQVNKIMELVNEGIIIPTQFKLCIDSEILYDFIK